MIQHEPIDNIRALMLSALQLRSICDKDADVLIEDFLGAQLEEKFTRGIGKFLLIDSAIAEREGKPEITKQGGSYALVNGHRELSQLSVNFCCNLLTDMAKKVEWPWWECKMLLAMVD